MRVISGKNRGLKLFSPKDLETRPTEDRVKENVFNLIGPNFYGSKVIDLFSGSGAIGIEFISRGSELVYFIENNKQAIEIINKNIAKAKVEKNAKILKDDAVKVIKNFNNEVFDFIYIDPPYKNSEIYIDSIKEILKANLLNDESLVIIEEDYSLKQDYSQYLNLVKEKKYGTSSISIWSLK
ncbi:MAG: 16S rRNA (guanine(966)-N(2))-methyltransferase RsmD [Peptoniphilaceae bacterium]